LFFTATSSLPCQHPPDSPVLIGVVEGAVSVAETCIFSTVRASVQQNICSTIAIYVLGGDVVVPRAPKQRLEIECSLSGPRAEICCCCDHVVQRYVGSAIAGVIGKPY